MLRSLIACLIQDQRKKKDIAIKQLPEDKSYNKHEQEMSNLWDTMGVCNSRGKYDSKYDKKILFEFMDGPPFPSGQLHMGHIMMALLKNVINWGTLMIHDKYYGFTNKIGTDCHGLPVEQKVNQKLHFEMISNF